MVAGAFTGYDSEVRGVVNARMDALEVARVIVVRESITVVVPWPMCVVVR